MVEGTEAQVPWATTEVGVEIPQPAYWFAISGTTVGTDLLTFFLVTRALHSLWKCVID